MTQKARMFAGVGAGIGFLMLVVYFVAIISEGNDTVWEIAPWVLAMTGASSTAAVGSATARHRLVLFAGVIFILIGVPAIFSVGAPLVIAELLFLLASSPAMASP